MASLDNSDNHAPMGYSPKDACKKIPCGMTFLYQEIAAGRLVALKAGNKTIITTESLRNYHASLPKAEIRTGLRKSR